jgi:metallo-beta-lactamase family protein
MQITFHGAARTVTGSQHLIEVNGRRILLDCGLYQGKRQEAFQRNRFLPFDAATVDVMILSHAHTDHAGNIPHLVKSGFKGDIYATFATHDLCSVMLMDSARIQQGDAHFVNKHHKGDERPTVEPLYTEQDAVKALRNFHAVDYERITEILPGITLTFLDAGHILGSAIVMLNIEDRDSGRDIALTFTGDLGQKGLPILRDPALVDRADVLIMESTYGDRLHGAFEDSTKKLASIVNETYQRNGLIIVPSFAIGRTQELVYALHKLWDTNQIPHLPIYVDSPLAINITEVFTHHPEAYDEETRQFLVGDRSHKDIFGFRDLHYTRSVDESKQLNSLDHSAVIISASGMCETGRILHHLANHIEDPRCTVLIAGYQSPDTLGYRIQQKQSPVRIFDHYYQTRAQVETITGFSAHADRAGLLGWAGAIKKKPVRTFLVHGDDAPLQALAEGLRKDIGFENVDIPDLHQSFEF